MIRIFAAIVIGSMLALYEVAAVSFLPSWARLAPLLPFCVLLVVSSVRSRALAAAFVGGLVLDAYVLGHVELAFVRLPIIILLLEFVASRFLTNRSVYASVALVLIARLFDWSSAWLVSALAVFLNLADLFWVGPHVPFAVLFWDALSVSVAFLLVASFTGRFRTRASSSYAS